MADGGTHRQSEATTSGVALTHPINVVTALCRRANEAREREARFALEQDHPDQIAQKVVLT